MKKSGYYYYCSFFVVIHLEHDGIDAMDPDGFVCDGIWKLGFGTGGTINTFGKLP